MIYSEFFIFLLLHGGVAFKVREVCTKPWKFKVVKMLLNQYYCTIASYLIYFYLNALYFHIINIKMHDSEVDNLKSELDHEKSCRLVQK